MDQGKRKLATSLLAAASLTTSAASLHAVTYTEPADVGQTLAGAQYTGTNNTTPLTGISGTMGTSTDADLYVLTITAATTFSATASSTAGIDTSLFLFNSTGTPVLANDDANNTTFQGAIPATALAAGTYYLGISLSGNEAVNSNSQQLFTIDQPTTNVRGIALNLNPTILSTFNGLTFFAETGAYSILLTGAATAVAPPAVPEPSTLAALAVGTTALGVFLRRRRQPKTA